MNAQSILNQIEELLFSEQDGLSTDMRSGRMFEAERVEKVCESIRELGRLYADLDVFPAAKLLVETYPEFVDFAEIVRIKTEDPEQVEFVLECGTKIRDEIKACLKVDEFTERLKYNPILYALIAQFTKEGNLFFKLANGAGLDEPACRKILKLMKMFCDKWYQENNTRELPKVVISMMITLMSINTYIYWYENELKNEEEADRIEEIYDEIAQAVVSCF
ncbi:hypothetical protein [Thermoflavimicrobium daqui]|uniref:Uncharacterized protein n=1 Tax=Thermoflavimicrobium daqui TaxID=2137476 RepID=A0A364K714_9BACL|nr:hypothetical protein [Thermoflavimicrobium daqui]RAL26083.1 hypothetical protein DL897_03505 [Thermoflavimicrobium daqui]